MLAAILYHQVAITDSAGDLDVLRRCLRWRSRSIDWAGSPSEFPSRWIFEPRSSSLVQAAPDVVFNLVETLAATDRLMPLATILLESLDLPFTGAGTRSLLATTHKLAAKQQMAAAQLPTPAWLDRARANSAGPVHTGSTSSAGRGEGGL
ncbi:MAG UNVERIFIED_CONTAM: hypothetical protein LVR18_18270 [Planctomycetaceae bacterium]|jgi:D-alanine-D-alanine ligase